MNTHDFEADKPLGEIEESVQQPPKLKFIEQAQKFWRKLPKKPFVLLWLGYFCFGLLLTVYGASWFSWLIAGVGSLLWAFSSSLTFFAPLTGTFAVLGSTSLSVVTVVVATVIALVLIGLLFMLDFGIKKALEGGVWIGGIVAAFLLIVNWLSNSKSLYTDGNIVVGNFLMALALLVAIVAITFGATGWLPMNKKGFSKKHTLFTFIGVTALGLVSGSIIANLLLLFLA